MNSHKLNPNFIARRTVYLTTLGAIAFAAQVACSDAPTKPAADNFAGSNTGGTPGASGSGTSGSFSTSGSGFGTGGTAGTGGSDTAGTAGTAAGTAGTGGTTPIVVIPPFCEGKTPTALPFDVQSAFYESQWQGDLAQISNPKDLADKDACKTRAQGAIGRCSAWRFTVNPAANPASWSAVAWVNRADDKFTHEPVCLATGATRISFVARGVKGGEVISVGGGSAEEVAITLTNEWKEYEVPLTGVSYMTPDGVQPSGFSWKVDPLPAPEVTPVTEFFIDSIQFVTTALVGNGGEGGAGAGGASGEGGGAN